MSYINRFFQISIFFIFVVFSVSSAFAQVVTEYQIAEILSEPDNNLIHTLKLGLNAEGDIETIIRTSSESEDIFDIQDLKDGKQLVLAESSGKDAVILYCTNICDEFNGGDMTVKYLYNGITDTYRYKFFYLIRTSNDDWELYTDSDELVVNLTLKPNMFWGILIGILRIDVNAY